MQVLLDEADRAAAANDHATALERLRAAYERDKSASILLNIGVALHRLGRYPEAAVVYERYLRDAGANPQRVSEVTRALAEVDSHVARVTVASSDPAARVWLDGRELVDFALGSTVRLAPGEHLVAAGRDAPLAGETIRVAAGEARSVWLNIPVAQPSAPSVVVVTVPEAPAPRYDSNKAAKAVTVVFSALGGVSIVTGIALGAYALSKEHEAGKHCLDHGDACDARGVELDKQAHAFGQASTITLGAGATLVVVGAVVGAVTRSSGVRAGRLPRVAVTPLPRGAYAAMEVSF